MEFIDASTSGGGRNLSFPNADDAVFFTDLPFTFSLFRDTFIAGARISIGTNGWISLDAASLPEFQNAALPARNVERPSGSEGVIPAAMIAPFFDDLILSGSAARVSTRLTGAGGSRLFVVQWSGVSILDSVGNDLDADLTFELILYEGSNDIRFVYQTMSGPRSDGSSATIGMQNLRRDEAVQTGFDQSIVESGAAVTYRFTNGTYVEELADSAPPGTPLVTDSGMRTSSRSELSASWITEGSKSSAVEFDYAIGTTPGGTDVRAFTTVRANSVVANGLLLENDATYYFAVRGRNTIGLVSEVGVSDGIVVDTSFVLGLQEIVWAILRVNSAEDHTSIGFQAF